MEDASLETKQCGGSHVCLSWLRGVYVDRCRDEKWDQAIRPYLLHLVACSIFADKSWTQASVSFLHCFRHLDQCGEYVWGVAALTYQYEQLGDVGFANTKQLDGYATLLQVIITTMVTFNIENLILGNLFHYFCYC